MASMPYSGGSFGRSQDPVEARSARDIGAHESYLTPMPDQPEQDEDRNLWSHAIAQPAIVELRRTLAAAKGAMSFDRACGLFAAVASTPTMRPPSEWIDLVKGDHVFEDIADVQRFANGVMALYNEVLRSVSKLDGHCCPPAEDHDAVREFCLGYLMIAFSDAERAQSPTARDKLLPMCALAGAVLPEMLDQLAHARNESPERYLQRSREELADTVVSLHAHWAEERRAGAAQPKERTQRRSAPKVGRNERCPCGSGKKFKKCCAQ
jgi:uncharacterized protein YecA (UPF0149 family)